MTAEIAILNRSAVVLAADSAVTVETQTAAKTYHTVNKLFTLSKYHPVGIMIYGNADFMDIPWETIIKTFRSHIAATSRATIREYVDDFIRYISQDIPNPPKEQTNHIFGIWHSYFEVLNQKIQAVLKSETRKIGGKPLDPNQDTAVIKVLMKEERDRLACLDTLDAFKGVVPDHLVMKYENEFQDAVRSRLSGRRLTRKTQEYIREIAGLIITKEAFSPIMSGIVIAGFGNKEYFPSLQYCRTDGIIDDKLIIKRDDYIDISRDDSSRVLAFAQREMVERFIDGIDSQYLGVVHKSVSRLLANFSDKIVDSYVTGAARSKAIKRGLARRAARLMVDELMEKHRMYRQEGHVHPIVSTVEILPKEELATLAESLVSLTSLKRRVSFDAETVGGPIDVCVISKGDGFIWIKRKHYFSQDLNPNFVSSYFFPQDQASGGNNAQIRHRRKRQARKP